MALRMKSAITVALAAVAAQVAAAPSVVVVWNQAALAEVRLSRLGPPVVARALAVAHTCMYDAWTAYDPVALSAVATTPRRPVPEHTQANKARAVSQAAYGCLINLFPAGAARLQAVMLAQGYSAADTSTNPATPQGVGNLAAAAVIASRRNDGANQYGDLAAGAYADYTGYQPDNNPMPFCLPSLPGACAINVADPYSWQPLINNLGVLQRFGAPHWERVLPFALASAAQFDTRPEAAAGPRYLQSPALYQADIAEILRNSAALDMQRKLIVEYWADGPASELPPGHWGLFAQAVAQRDNHSIDQDAKLFFAMHNASHDAGIVAWHLKRKYDGVRPITSVRYFGQGQAVYVWGGPGQPNQWIDAGKWSPYNPGSNLTPPFPGWVSGHATFSAASAAVLRAFTGSDAFGFSTTIAPGFGRVEPGVPAVPTVLSYPTFTAAANEAAASRLYAGIHFSDDNSVGLVLGDLAGQQAWARSQYLFDGGLSATGSSRATAGAANRLGWWHTVDGRSNRLLLVGVSTTDGSNAVRSVSYAGLELARLGAQNGPRNDNRVELWYRLNPPAGSARVLVQMSQFNDVVAGAVSYTGVHQQLPFGTFRAASSDSNAACVTLANAPAPLVATMLAVNGDAGSVSVGGGLSTAWNASSNPGSRLDNLLAFTDVIGVGATGPAAPLATLCNTWSRPKHWAMVAVPLQPAQLPLAFTPPPAPAVLDLAQGKLTMQSSAHTAGSSPAVSAAKAVDGNTNGMRRNN